MQNHPLVVSSLIEHAASAHARAEVVSRLPDGQMHRCTYADIDRRSRQLANALAAAGLTQGERVATLAWNGYRHLELFFGRRRRRIPRRTR